MFKLVVLCAFIAASGAEPGVVVTPVAYSATVLSPATTTISKQASSVVHPSPLLYSAPLGFAHYIKKRSAPLALSNTIVPTSYISTAPLVTAYSTPSLHAAPLVPALPLTSILSTAHFIKKRSAPLAYQSTYIAPTTYYSQTPFATTYSAPLVHGPIEPAAPLAQIYTATHFIKKRSAPLAYHSTYIAPTTYISGAPLATTYSAPLVHAPILPAAPLAPIYTTTHLIKKRSAPIAYFSPTSYSSQSRIDIHGAPLVTSYASFPTPLAYSTPLAVRHVL